MGKKKIIARYKQLRILIIRAKDDAKLWGTNKKPLVLQGIKELSAHDYTVYDDAYNKFVKKRIKTMNENKLNEAKEEESEKKRLRGSHEEVLTRIADALERLADLLEKEAE